MLKSLNALPALVVGAFALAPSMHAAANVRNPATVFVMTNAAEQNEVIAYNRGYNGEFTQAGHYPTEGRGSGGLNDPLQSQGSLVLSNDHKLLFAVNAGSGTLSSFLVGLQGKLVLADKIATGGSEPVSSTSYQNRVYVLDGAGAGTVVGFTVDGSGRLTTIPNASAFLSATSAGGSSISISPDGNFVIVTERLTNKLDVFPVLQDGTLGPLQSAASPLPGTFDGQFDPQGQYILSATGPAGAVDAATISSFAVNAAGSLVSVTASLPTFGAANCWNAITPNGKYVYTSNAGSSTISAFSIGKGGILQPVGSTVAATQAAGSTNIDITVSGDSGYLYVLNAIIGQVGVFKINENGSLTPEGTIDGLSKDVGYNGIAAL